MVKQLLAIQAGLISWIVKTIEQAAHHVHGAVIITDVTQLTHAYKKNNQK